MTGRARPLAVLLLAFALAACVPLPQARVMPTGGGVVVSAVSPRFLAFTGRKLPHDPPFLGVPDTNFYVLRSWLDRRTGEARYQLYVSDSYSGAERNWDAAHDGAGRPLAFVAIDHHQIACIEECSWAEDFAADLPESELRASPEGLSVVFTARSGAAKRIDLAPAEITAQLRAVDAARAQRQAVLLPSAPQ
jgi:hypothetical protein